MANGDSASSRRRDFGFALVIVAVCALTIWEARKQPVAPFDPVGAAAVPIWTAAIMILLAGSILVRLALGRSTRGGAQSMFAVTEAADASYLPRPGMSVAAILISLAYAAAIPIAGFMAATAGFLVVLGWTLSDRSVRAAAITIAIAIAGGVGLTLGFRALLVDLP